MDLIELALEPHFDVLLNAHNPTCIRPLYFLSSSNLCMSSSNIGSSKYHGLATLYDVIDDLNIIGTGFEWLCCLHRGDNVEKHEISQLIFYKIGYSPVYRRNIDVLIKYRWLICFLCYGDTYSLCYGQSCDNIKQSS